MPDSQTQDEIRRLRDAIDGSVSARAPNEQLAEVFSEYRPRLQRLIDLRLDSRLLRRVESEDILQDAFMEIQRRISAFLQDPAVPIYVWFRQMVLQSLIDTQRKHLGAQRRNVNREVNRPAARGQSQSFSIAAQVMGRMTSPSQAAIRQERVEQVREALASMNEMDREILVLRHLEELNNQEVAGVLKIDKSAASKRYIRALKKLKTSMGADSNDG